MCAVKFLRRTFILYYNYYFLELVTTSAVTARAVTTTYVFALFSILYHTSDNEEHHQNDYGCHNDCTKILWHKSPLLLYYMEQTHLNALTRGVCVLHNMSSSEAWWPTRTSARFLWRIPPTYVGPSLWKVKRWGTPCLSLPSCLDPDGTAWRRTEQQVQLLLLTIHRMYKLLWRDLRFCIQQVLQGKQIHTDIRLRTRTT